MDKKNYQKPYMKVVKFKYAPLLQAASKENSSRQYRSSWDEE